MTKVGSVNGGSPRTQLEGCVLHGGDVCSLEVRGSFQTEQQHCPGLHRVHDINLLLHPFFRIPRALLFAHIDDLPDVVGIVGANMFESGIP